MDSEGIPAQELCAIAVDINNLSILDIYHKYAFARGDTWSRRNIHGLNSSFIYDFGFSNAQILQKDFDKWKKRFNIIKVFENCPNSISNHFCNDIHDLRLPIWSMRYNKPYHIIANRLKESGSPICDTNCSPHIHSSYKPYLNFRSCRKPVERLKLQHGFHCALYDTYELYLFYKDIHFRL